MWHIREVIGLRACVILHAERKPDKGRRGTCRQRQTIVDGREINPAEIMRDVAMSESSKSTKV